MVKVLNKNELAKKEIEEYYTNIYATRKLHCSPEFYETHIHPDCLFKGNNLLYAVEATGYFYQQETDYANRLYKKVNKFIKKDNYLTKIYQNIGRKPLLNIVDAVYYRQKQDIIDDLYKNITIIEEIAWNNEHFYCINTSLINNLEQMFLDKKYLRIEIILKKKYLIPIKIIIIYDVNVVYKTSRTLVPITSFSPNYNYNFSSLRSLIDNKEYKLKNIYRDSLKKQKIKYDKFILLIHPLDFSINISPDLLYKELYDEFIKTQYDEIIIILDKKIMAIDKDGYEIYE